MIKDRIIQLIEYKRIPKEEFYVKIGMTSASFRGNAKNTPLNSNAIENILSEIPDVNSEWLLTGKGEMLLSDENKPKEENKQAIMPSEMLESLYNELRDEKKKLLSIIENQQDIIKKQSETVLSQQRTIEKLADLQKGIAEGARGVVSKAAHG